MPSIRDRVSQDRINEVRKIHMAKHNRPNIEMGMDDEEEYSFDAGIPMDAFDVDDEEDVELARLEQYKTERDRMVEGRYGTPMYENNVPQEQSKNMEDMIFDSAAKTITSTWGWLQRLVPTFSTYTDKQKSDWYLFVMKGSILFFIAGFTFLVSGREWLPFMVAGLANLGVAIPLFMCKMDKIRKEMEQEDIIDLDSNSDNEDEDFTINNELNSAVSEYFSEADEVISEEEELDEWDESEGEDEGDTINSDLEELVFDDSFIDIPEETHTSITSGGNNGDVQIPQDIDAIAIDKNLITRQYLFERMVTMLPDVNPGYHKVTALAEDSDDFAAWESLLFECAEFLNSKLGEESDEYPELLYAEDQYMFVRLDIKRVSWLKNPQNLVDELVSRYSYDDKLCKKIEGIYGWCETVGNKTYIRIMKGIAIKVGLKDMSQIPEVKDKLLDLKYGMPVILGVGALGEPIVADFKDAYALLVTGEPRTGKSWFVKNILYQLMAYNTPEQLHFYFADSKDSTSDFARIASPHVKAFVSGPDATVSMLKRLLEVEAVKNEKIIGGAEALNIADYNKKFPDNPIPYKIVLIDEIIALTESMDKELRTEFQELLLALITKTPAFGIRVMLIPHKLNNSIINKTITDMIPFRANVRGNSSGIVNACGDEAKSFKYKLTQMGDMAVRTNCVQGRNEVFYCHSVILSTENSINDKIFETQARLWAKMYPNEIEGSRFNKVYGETE